MQLLYSRGLIAQSGGNRETEHAKMETSASSFFYCCN